MGHSAGGVLARLYLSPDSFKGVSTRASTDRASDNSGASLNQRNLRRGGRLSTYVEERYPWTYFSLMCITLPRW